MHAGVYIPQAFLTSLCVSATQSAGCSDALVYAQFVYSYWGTRVGGFKWSMQNTCRLAWGVYF